MYFNAKATVALFSSCILQLTKAHFKYVFNYYIFIIIFNYCVPNFYWVFFKYPKISKNGNPLFFPVISSKKAPQVNSFIVVNPYRVQPSPK